jgi:uncharacterized protein with ATP-grasp and redox domains
MRTYYECLPCFSKQALTMLEFIPQKNHENFLRESMHMLGNVEYSLTPPELARKLYSIAYEYTDKIDFYAEKKKESNDFLIKIYAELQQKINNSENPFETAVRYAIAGNIIDFGAIHDFSINTIHQELEKALNAAELTTNSIQGLEKEIEKAKQILYIGDNAGEIVFDKLFIENLPTEKIVFSVRGGPIINDALIDDAEQIGLTKIVKVISNGAAIPGTCISECSKEFQEYFNNADLIISKGQGNYETLSDSLKNIFFLLKIKCPVVASNIGAPLGQCVCLDKNYT